MSVVDAADNPRSQSRDLRSGNPSQRYAALVESTDGAIIVRSLDGTILSWDAAAERLYGYTAEEALGKPLSLIVPPDRASETINGLHSVAMGGRIDPSETVRVRRDQTRIDVSMTMSGVRDGTNHVVGALSVARDISAEKGIERALGTSEAALSDANIFLQAAERLSHIGTWTLRFGADVMVTCSPETLRVLGLDSSTRVTVELFFSFVHPDDRAGVEEAMSAALRERRSYESDYRIIGPDGSIRWVHVWAEPEFDADGEPVRVLGVVRDITERRLADEALQASERRFRLLAEHARDFIFRISLAPEPRFEYASLAALAITGYTPEELYDQPALVASLVASEDVDAMATLLHSGQLLKPIDVEVKRKDGSLIWVSQQLTFVYDDRGELIAVEGVSRDITERKQAEADRLHATLHDPLTGLPNRLLLRESLELACARARAEGHEVTVVSIDLDDFAMINDTYGPEVGDAVLVAVADLATEASNGEMTVGCFGGDEFVIVGESVDGAGAAAAFVERFQHCLRHPIMVDDIPLSVHTRIGVAVGDPNVAARRLLGDAGMALARAKQQPTETGVAYFDSDMRSRAHERLALVTDLYPALERNQFRLRYQPIIRLADNQIIGAEALLRWQHPQRGLINPTDFISLAEDTGLIVKIGDWVINQACSQIRSWTDANATITPLGISVNVSVKQLRSPDIVTTVAHALDRAGIDPRRLTLEMTESVCADDLKSIRRVLTQLRDLGVRTAIDDFGTGYSSLAYLKHLPLDTIKIDKAFVDGLGTDERDTAIIESTLTISRALTPATIAEGVETPDQAATLRRLGCDAAQGFYFSKPLTDTDFAALIVAPEVNGLAGGASHAAAPKLDRRPAI